MTLRYALFDSLTGLGAFNHPPRPLFCFNLSAQCLVAIDSDTALIESTGFFWLMTVDCLLLMDPGLESIWLQQHPYQGCQRC